MGCGSSATDSTSDLNKNPKSNLDVKKKSAKELETSSTCITSSNNKDDNDCVENKDNAGSRTTCRDSGIDSAKTNDGRRIRNNENTTDNQQLPSNNLPNSKGVAFNVVLDGPDQEDSIIKRHPPKRLLQKLDQAPPKLTAEMLAERQQLTEERRKKLMEGRAKSAKRTSRCRQNILAARDYNEKETVEENIKKINDKISTADSNRAHVQEEIKTKQRQREMRARQTRERARQFNQAGTEELDYDIEQDEMFNNDDTDSWLDGGNNTVVSKGSTSSERIYDGRSSPVKKFHPVTSAERRRKQHSPNTDSDVEDDGWANRSNGHKQNDDFFDT